MSDFTGDPSLQDRAPFPAHDPARMANQNSVQDAPQTPAQTAPQTPAHNEGHEAAQPSMPSLQAEVSQFLSTPGTTMSSDLRNHLQGTLPENPAQTEGQDAERPPILSVQDGVNRLLSSSLSATMSPELRRNLEGALPVEEVPSTAPQAGSEEDGSAGLQTVISRLLSTFGTTMSPEMRRNLEGALPVGEAPSTPQQAGLEEAGSAASLINPKIEVKIPQLSTTHSTTLASNAHQLYEAETILANLMFYQLHTFAVLVYQGESVPTNLPSDIKKPSAINVPVICHMCDTYESLREDFKTVFSLPDLPDIAVRWKDDNSTQNGSLALNQSNTTAVLRMLAMRPGKDRLFLVAKKLLP